MSYREQRKYIRVSEAIDLIARSDFGGSHDEAWKDIQAAWQDGAIVFRGKYKDRVGHPARINKIEFDGDERARIIRRDGKFFLKGSSFIGAQIGGRPTIDALEMERRQLREHWPDAMTPDEKGGLDQKARSKGGSQSRHNRWLQEALGRIVVMLNNKGTTATQKAVWEWLKEKATPDAAYEFQPPIPGCDELYVDGDTLTFTDQAGKEQTRKRRSLDTYISKALAENPPKLSG